MQFLLERLAAGPFDLKAAVQAQVERIVSARVYDTAAPGAAQPFGMPSIVDLDACDRAMLEAYAARLTRMIRQYEPRLGQPSVALASAPGPLAPYALLVRGQLGPEDKVEEFSFPLPGRAGD